MKAAVLLLAAGGSRRMGAQKLLLPWGASTVVEQALAAALASPADEVIVVTGSAADEVAAACGGALALKPPPRYVHNPRWQEGMLTSIQAGLTGASARVDGFFVALGDMPLVEPSVYANLMGAWRPGQIVVPTWEGERGHPVLLPMTLAEAVAALPPADIGLRELLRRHARLVVELPVQCPGVRIDLDTPELYNRHAPRRFAN